MGNIKMFEEFTNKENQGRLGLSDKADSLGWKLYTLNGKFPKVLPAKLQELADKANVWRSGRAK